MCHLFSRFTADQTLLFNRRHNDSAAISDNAMLESAGSVHAGLDPLHALCTFTTGGCSKIVIGDDTTDNQTWTGTSCMLQYKVNDGILACLGIARSTIVFLLS